MQSLTVMPVAIQALAQYCTAQGHLSSSAMSGGRLTDGIIAHIKVQKQYAAKDDLRYNKEVPLTIDCARKDYILRLSGRADGIFTTDGGHTVIHEIKSTYLPIALIEEPLSDSHIAQMKIYTYIFAAQNALTAISMRLSYYSISEEKEKSFCYDITLDELEKEFTAYVDDYCILADICIASKRALQDTSEEVKFPFDSYRAFQREAAAQVYTSIKEHNTLLLEAPTGTGKTMAALFPAIKALGTGNCEKLFYTGAKNQTLLVASDALALMRKKGLHIKSIVITAKEKSCKQEEVNCDPVVCPYAQDFFTKQHQCLPEIAQNDSFSPADIQQFSEKYMLCPYELSLSLAEICDCVICDYNYIFDPQSKLKRFFTFGGNYAFLIDEAHNMVERSREMFSASLSREQISKMRSQCKQLPKVTRALSKLGKAMDALSEQMDENWLVLDDAPKDIINTVESVLSKIEEYAFEGQTLPQESGIIFKELLRYAKICELYSKDYYTTYCTGEKKRFTINLFCLQPSPYIREALDKGISAIYFSATLSPYAFYSSMLGGNEKTYHYALPSPFEKENLLVCADYSIDTTYNARGSSYAAIASRIACACRSKKGNYIVFFPSFEYLNHVLAEFNGIAFDGDVLIHTAGFNKEQREEFISEFRPDRDRTLLGFSVMGSHFGEGIDLPGEALSGVIIVGVGLPMVTLQRQLLKNYFDETMDCGFDYAYTYPGMNKVLQAGGRVIRTAEDRGFILLLDKRFSREQYARLLPPHWDIQHMKNEKQLFQLLKEFWAH